QQPSALRVYPRLGFTSVGKVKSVEQRSLVAFDRRGPLTRANRFLEFPGRNLDQIRIEPELSSHRENEIAAEGVSDRVDRLVERMVRKWCRAFRPEVGLDAVARKTLSASQSENRKQAQRPLLLRGYGDRGSLVPQGKRSEKLEDQHSCSERAL